MKRNLLLLTVVGALCAGISGAAPATPNIVVILSDDYGYGSAGCYGADPRLVRTPNIDRLAREGRRFTDANTTSSVCSPRRISNGALFTTARIRINGESNHRAGHPLFRFKAGLVPDVSMIEPLREWAIPWPRVPGGAASSVPR